ncbi:MAG: hypothetical protein R2692_08250 [Microbacterium sp.]
MVNTRNLYWVTLAVLVIVYLVVLWVDRSRLGHLAQATRENELRVQVLGLSPYRAKLTVFVVAALCASLAGVAYMLLQSGTQPSSVGADLTITVLVMVVLGGVGFRWGAIVGGVLYTILVSASPCSRAPTGSTPCPTCCTSRSRAAVHPRRVVHPRGDVPARRHRRHRGRGCGAVAVKRTRSPLAESPTRRPRKLGRPVEVKL